MAAAGLFKMVEVEEFALGVDRDLRARWDQMAAEPRGLSHRAAERPIHLNHF